MASFTTCKKKDIVYGFSRRHHRNIPIPVSNITLKYFNHKYLSSKQLKIKDTLLPHIEFKKSIANEIDSYLSFRECKDCDAVTWSDYFGQIDCNNICMSCFYCYYHRKHEGCADLYGEICLDCVDRFEYDWRCANDGCNVKYCDTDCAYNMEREYDGDENVYCSSCKLFEYCHDCMGICEDCDKYHCPECTKDINDQLLCLKCAKCLS